MQNKILALFFIIIFAAFNLSCKQTVKTETQAQKEINKWDWKIIQLGYTPYTVEKAVNWRPLFSKYDGYMLAASDWQKAVNYIHRLYNILKEKPLPHAYRIYIGQHFSAGTTNYRKAYNYYLQFKYGASDKEIEQFIERYKDVYQYRLLEKKVLNNLEHKIGGMPILIHPNNYYSHLDKYYDWLKYYSRHQPPQFYSLVKLNQIWPHKKIILWLNYHNNDKIKVEVFKNPVGDSNPQDLTIFINFGRQTTLDSLNSPLVVKQVKKLLLSN